VSWPAGHWTHRRSLPPLLFVLACALGCTDLTDAPPDQPPEPGPPVSVAFTVATAADGPRVPADFLGLGFEMPVMADPLLRSDRVLDQMLSNLGSGTLRFGGGAVEQTVWSPAAPAAGDTEFHLTPADVDAVFGLARRIGWRVTVALPFARFDSAAAAAEAMYLVESGGDALLGVEIGNEPNLYPLQGLRSPAYSVDSLAADFDAYAAAILARAPSAPLVAPATWCTGGGAWFAGFLERRHGSLAFGSHHFYPMGRTAPAGSTEEASVANMLSPELMARSQACVDTAMASAAQHQLALRVDETNSAYGFGRPGVSDVFASALWGVDYLFTLAELGVAGVNLEMGTDANGGLTCAGVYLPMCAQDGKFIARPLYYAMLMFHEAAVGRVVPVQAGTPLEANVVAHAAVGDDGAVRVTIINKEETTPVDATVALDPGGAGSPAGVLRLVGNSLTSQSVSLGGSFVQDDGTWAPKSPEPVVGGASYSVSVPPASAALLVIGAAPALMAARSPPGPAAGSWPRRDRSLPRRRSSRDRLSIAGLRGR
jgi:hypothetical protein